MPSPARTSLKFKLGSIPVEVLPGFWLLTLFLGFPYSQSTPLLITWILAVFISVLVHELGHAVFALYYGSEVKITLHGMGGMTSHSQLTKWPTVITSFAGPAAGFVFIGIVLLALDWRFDNVLTTEQLPFFAVSEMSPTWLYFLSFHLLWVNISWGLLNLLPILPLDGGQILNGLLQISLGPKALLISLAVSFVCAASFAAFAFLYWQALFAALLFAYFAYSSLRDFWAVKKHFASIAGE